MDGGMDGGRVHVCVPRCGWFFFVFGRLHVVVCGLCMSVRVRASRWLLVSRLAQQIYTCVQGHAQTQQTCRAHKHTHKHMDTYARTHVAKGG